MSSKLRPATAADAADQGLAAHMLTAQAAHWQSHIDQFGDGSGRLQERVKRDTARAAAHRRSAWQIRRSLNAANRPSSIAPVVVAPRTAARTRGRKARTAARRAAGAKAGQDPGGSESDPPEPPSPRLCRRCGGEIPPHRSPKATYCSDQHADRDRQRRKRARHHADPLVEPELRPLGAYKVRPEELGALRSRPGCRCNGHHIPAQDGDGLRCLKCGHWRDITAAAA